MFNLGNTWVILQPNGETHRTTAFQGGRGLAISPRRLGPAPTESRTPSHGQYGNSRGVMLKHNLRAWQQNPSFPRRRESSEPGASEPLLPSSRAGSVGSSAAADAPLDSRLRGNDDGWRPAPTESRTPTPSPKPPIPSPYPPKKCPQNCRIGLENRPQNMINYCARKGIN